MMTILRRYFPATSRKGRSDQEKRHKPKKCRSYVYNPLDKTERTVRLLKLFTTSNLDDTLEGELFTAKLADDPAYRAVSDMWGDPSPKDVIILSGTSLRIGGNLGKALRHIRRYHKSAEHIVLWADGVCIDQTSIEERNHQVALMGSIYLAARSVCVWLDEMLDVENPAYLSLINSPNTDHPTASIKASDHEPSQWGDVLQILDNPYWSRLWIQGEMLNALKLRIYLRNITISDASFRRFKTNVQSLLFDILYSHDKRYIVLSDHIRVHHICLRHNPSRDCRLTTLARDGLHLAVTEPRDVIYGSIHIAADHREGDITVDYELSTQQVFLQAFRQHVRMHSDLGFLCAYSDLLDHNFDANHFPRDSWLQSWILYGDNDFDRDSASGCVPCLPEAVANDSHLLRAHGLHLDTVLKATAVSSSRNSRLTLRYIWRMLSETLPALADLSETRGDVLDAVVHELLTAGCFVEWDLETTTRALYSLRSMALDDNLDISDRLFSEAGNAILVRLGESVQRAFTEIVASLWNQRLLVSKTGRIGIIANLAVQLGDEIWLIFGCNHLAVLRPRGEFKQFVSSAYIPGYITARPSGGEMSIQCSVRATSVMVPRLERLQFGKVFGWYRDYLGSNEAVVVLAQTAHYLLNNPKQEENATTNNDH